MYSLILNSVGYLHAKSAALFSEQYECGVGPSQQHVAGLYDNKEANDTLILLLVDQTPHRHHTVDC